MAEDNNQNENNTSLSQDDNKLFELEIHAKEIAEKLKTHQKINTSLCGNIVEIEQDYAKVELICTNEMVADEMGLIHGGFTFAAADFAAMVAVNHPNVVLVGGKVKFLAPLEVGDTVIFEAHAKFNDARKRDVFVIGKKHDMKIFEAEFMAVILKKHILKIKSDNPKMPSVEKD